MKASKMTLTLALLFALSAPACKSDFAEDGDDGTDDAGPLDGGDGDGGDTANQPPVAVDDSAQTRTEESVEIRLIENDSDSDGDALIISEVVQPANGFVQILSGELRVEYTSLADFVGIDSFEYTVSDQMGGSDQGTVTVNVEEIPVLTLEITAPTDAEIVEGPDVTVSFEVTGCAVTRPAADPEGCHVHRFIDGAPYEDADGIAVGWYSPADFTLTPLTAGAHEILLELISNDGSDDPVIPYVSDSVTIEVTIPAG